MVHLTCEQNCLLLFLFTKLMILLFVGNMYVLKQDWPKQSSGITEISDGCYEVKHSLTFPYCLWTIRMLKYLFACFDFQSFVLLDSYPKDLFYS